MLKKLFHTCVIFTLVTGFLVCLRSAGITETEKPVYKVVEDYVSRNIKGEKPAPGVLKKDLFLQAVKIDIPPGIDGRRDAVWEKANGIYAWDNIARVNVLIKALYTSDKIFFLVTFNDPDESRKHKTWHWDKKEDIYVQGNEREDCFVFKWNMGPVPVDLSVYADNDYTADIWFWKADRTDPVGYADDKSQRLSSKKIKKSMKTTTRTGKRMYFLRTGDKGIPTYSSTLPIDYEKDIMPKWNYRKPEGSRGDIRAKGLWADGRWTIEFARDLKTGHLDDIQFDVSGTYQFGISRLEMSGGRPRPEWTNPLYACGDVFNSITLSFSKEKK